MNSIYLDNQKGSSKMVDQIIMFVGCTSALSIFSLKKKKTFKGVTLYNLLISRYIKDGYNIHMRNSKDNTFM
jgi:hypothetical protein